MTLATVPCLKLDQDNNVLCWAMWVLTPALQSLNKQDTLDECSIKKNMVASSGTILNRDGAAAPFLFYTAFLLFLLLFLVLLVEARLFFQAINYNQPTYLLCM